MDIILLKNLSTVGDKHEVVTVKDGYGRNYLIPKGFGIIANDTNRKRLEEIKVKAKEDEDKRISEYEEMAAALEGQTLKIGVKAGTSGKIFGSITNVQIAAQLREHLDIDIERRKIEMPEEIKEIGTYTAKVNFHPQVSSNIQFELVQE
jgi:large subunit ribosomal protein L9